MKDKCKKIKFELVHRPNFKIVCRYIFLKALLSAIYFISISPPSLHLPLSLSLYSLSLFLLSISISLYARCLYFCLFLLLLSIPVSTLYLCLCIHSLSFCLSLSLAPTLSTSILLHRCPSIHAWGTTR